MQPSQFFQGTKRWHVTRPLHCNYILCTFKTRSLLLSFQVMCVNVFTTIIMCFIVLSGIYANISLFLSYSEVTIATQIQSVSRSDGSSSHDGSAPGDDLYSPECQRRPCQLDELQRQNSSEDLIGHQDKTTRTRRILCRIWHAQELNHAMLVSSGQRRTAPPTEPGFSQGFLLNLCHRWSFGSLPLSPLACLFGDTWLIAQTLLEESWTGLCQHWITNELTLTGKMTCYCPLALLTNYFPVRLCKAALTISIV